jgi:hypothetical protein
VVLLTWDDPGGRRLLLVQPLRDYQGGELQLEAASAGTGLNRLLRVQQSSSQ